MNMLFRYRAIVFDIDSTLVTIEGVDELARKKNMFGAVSALTTAAMNGQILFEDVFFRRLALIRPTSADLLALGKLYCRSLTPGAAQIIYTLQNQGARVFVASGGYNPAVNILTRSLGIPDSQVFANELFFDARGDYTGVNRSIPLWKNDGKRQVIKTIRENIPGEMLLVGDSMSDWEAAQDTCDFLCFAGVAARPAVMERSTHVITKLHRLCHKSIYRNVCAFDEG